MSNTWLGHPRGLFLLFTTEMWERFSYYGMRALLVLFLTRATLEGGFGWSDKEALSLYGTYTMLVYMTPVIGGWLSDRFLGQRRAIVIGGVLMVVGHFLMAGPHLIPVFFEQRDGVPVEQVLVKSGLKMAQSESAQEKQGQSIPESLSDAAQSMGLGSDAAEVTELAYKGIKLSFYLALAFIVIGNGFFKPNISTMVGSLYHEDDHRRDGGFTIFYMGINLGAAIGGLVTGYLGETLGWYAGFSAAGFGMLISIVIFMGFSQRLLGDIGREPGYEEENPQHVRQPLTVVERDRIRVILVLGLFTIIFWAGFEQAGGQMNLFTYEHTNRLLMGFEVPASWFQSLNPVFIILFAPLVASIWVKLGSKEPDSPAKFAIGMLLLALGFVCMMGAALELKVSATHKSSMLWLVGAYFFHTMGELCLSPIGLSMVTKLAPVKLVSLMMGVWFLFVALANKLAGFIGGFTEDLGALTLFAGIALAAVIAAGLLFLISGRLVDWMHQCDEITH